MLQGVVVCCSVLQCAILLRSGGQLLQHGLQQHLRQLLTVCVCYSYVLQCVAACVAVSCSVRCSVLQLIEVCL